MARFDIVCLPQEFQEWTSAMCAKFELALIQERGNDSVRIEKVSTRPSFVDGGVFIVPRDLASNAARLERVMNTFRYSGGIQAWPSAQLTDPRQVLTAGWFAWSGATGAKLDGSVWMRWFRRHVRDRVKPGVVSVRSNFPDAAIRKWPNAWFSVGAERAFDAGFEWKQDASFASSFAPLRSSPSA